MAWWPTVILEYCEYTLSEFQSDRTAPLPFLEKGGIIFGIYNGLDAIHMEGFIHGDIKSENILISLEDGAIIPKLADFGDSIKVGNDGMLLIGGTDPWRAPEVDAYPMPILQVQGLWTSVRKWRCTCLCRSSTIDRLLLYWPVDVASYA